MSDTKGDDEVLTGKQVTEQYGISDSTLYRLRRDRILLPIEAGTEGGLLVRPHEYTYRKSDIERAAQIIAVRRKNRGRKAKAQQD